MANNKKSKKKDITREEYTRVAKRMIFERLCEDTKVNPNDYGDEHISQVLELFQIKVK